MSKPQEPLLNSNTQKERSLSISTRPKYKSYINIIKYVVYAAIMTFMIFFSTLFVRAYFINNLSPNHSITNITSSQNIVTTQPYVKPNTTLSSVTQYTEIQAVDNYMNIFNQSIDSILKITPHSVNNSMSKRRHAPLYKHQIQELQQLIYYIAKNLHQPKQIARYIQSVVNQFPKEEERIQMYKEVLNLFELEMKNKVLINLPKEVASELIADEISKTSKPKTRTRNKLLETNINKFPKEERDAIYKMVVDKLKYIDKNNKKNSNFPPTSLLRLSGG